MSSGLPVPDSVATAAPRTPDDAPASRVPSGHLRRAMRTQVMVLSFYLADALFMAAYARMGHFLRSPRWSLALQVAD